MADTQSPHRRDDFNGDNAKLIRCIDALLDLDDDKCLVPHGLGGRGSHSYRLLVAARDRLTAVEPVEHETLLNDIAVMMSEFVDNWPQPKKVSTALALIAKTLRAAPQPKAMADQSTEARLREALKPFVDCCEYIDENESDEEWAKFRLLIKDYRRAQEAFSLPVQDTSDELTRLRAEVEAMRGDGERELAYFNRTHCACSAAQRYMPDCPKHGMARTTLNGGQANGG